jgi:redox-sensitive bicupin YhaK (pirin superfamily)
MKKLTYLKTSQGSHWVGDGFPVRSIFTYNDLAKEISPFLLMDYAGPAEFPPAAANQKARGVGEHPHRGFETVTIVYSGEVVHKDSAGGGGHIGPGDVQWMTAASGLVHEEKHGPDFAKAGGRFEMVQLWVNLPAKNKMDKPRYQGLISKNIPVVHLPDNAGHIRIIAGELDGNIGPALTFSPINMWDAKLDKGKSTELKFKKGHTCVVFVLSGQLQLPAGETIREAQLGVADREDEVLKLTAVEDTIFLILSGEPLNEPIVGYGPFVMNTMPEIQKAFDDFNNGLMGQIGSIEGSEV